MAPDMLNNLLGILLRFRIVHIAFVGDISKMLNSVSLSETDQHVHRLLWRNMCDDKPADQYILNVVPFGDRSSGAIAMLAMKQITDMMCDISPEVVDVLISNSYVYDIYHSMDETDKSNPANDRH